MTHQANEPFNSIRPSSASFGEWLKRQRKLRDLTQDDLAPKVGCARVTIRKFESDETRPSKQMAELLAQALDVPSEERAAFVQFARGTQAEGAEPAPQTTRARSTNNLPVQPTRFIGREREVAELKRLLTTTHLLTLTGSGGTGKTRLSLQVAAGHIDSFKDGVWLVELAPLSDPLLVVTSIASVLGVRQEQDRPLLATMLDWLRDRQVLLVLDNCEHLIDPCAHFADAVLHSSAETRILSSSREPLGIAGELPWRVPSLEIPNPDHQIPSDALARYESIQLFVERASFANASFQLNLSNADAVSQICYRLDGIPLAIELAASKVRTMSVKQIAERLDDRFRLLTGGSRTALPRQQTLRGMIDWSYGLLSEPERVFLRRLSVFAGGWTLEAAETVCTDVAGAGLSTSFTPRRISEVGWVASSPASPDPLRRFTGERPMDAPASEQLRGSLLQSADILDLLTRLVDKSLVVLDDHGGETRYRMLETIRQYAREKLLDANESERLRDRHLVFFLKLAERAEPILGTGRRVEWMPRLELEHDNFRAALEWACERDPEVARWLAGLLMWFWGFGDHVDEALAWYERVLALPDREARTRGMALALLGAGVHVANTSASDDEKFLERSVSLWRELGDKPRLAQALNYLGYLMVHKGQSEDACTLYETNELVLRQFAAPWILAQSLSYWGRALVYARRDYASARALHEEGFALAKLLDDPFIIGAICSDLGHWAMQQGDYETASRFHREGLAWRQQDGTRWGPAAAISNLADATYLQQDYVQARLLYLDALELYRAVGMNFYIARLLMRLGKVALRQNQNGQAAQLIAESLAVSRKRQDQSGMARCLAAYAELHRAQGHLELAVRLLAITSLPAALQAALNLVERVELERTLAAARAALSPAAFDAAWTAGQALTLEQAVALAMGDG